MSGTVAAIVAIVAAAAAAVAAGLAISALNRSRRASVSLEEEIEQGKARFDEVIAHESELRARELEGMLSLARSQAISRLADEERRIVEERRREIAERERDATTKLVASLVDAQRSVEQRFADWGSQIDALAASLAAELERVSARHAQLIAALEQKLIQETERLEGSLEEHRGRVNRVRADLERAMEEVAAAVVAELETHGAERRRALQEVAERLRRRERELQEQIEREQNESSQRVAVQLKDVERRQVEQVKRFVARETQRASEAAVTAVRPIDPYGT